MLFEEWRSKARVARFLRDDVKNSALWSNYGTFGELGQRRAVRGFAATADLDNSAFSLVEEWRLNANVARFLRDG